MITPSFSPTATERVLPKLALDFTTASLDPRVTFTRTTDATHPATYTNSSGFIVSATNNQPRFDYDPITLACKGLLIEESRTNQLKYSSDFSNTSWTNFNTDITTGSITSPDNTLSGIKVADNSNSNEHFIEQPISTTTNQAYTQSVYVKAGNAIQFRVMVVAIGSSSTVSLAVFTQVGGVFSFNSISGLITSASITPVGNGWYRAQVTYTLNGTVTNHLVRIYPYVNGVYSGTGTYSYFWGAQNEAGAFPTSYIPTTTTALTRNADVATMTGTNFSSWYNSSAGTFTATYSSFAKTAYPDLLNVSDGTNLNRFEVFIDGSNGYTVIREIVSNAVQGNTAYSSIQGSVVKGSFAYSSAGVAASGNGGATSVGNNVTHPAGLNKLSLGALPTGTGNFLNGYISKFNYYPQRLTANELQAFSK